jgi:hypothetical protein
VFPRRTLLVIAVVMGLTALVATLAARHDARTPAHGAGVARPPASVAPPPPDVSAVLSAAPRVRPRTISAELGDQIALTVTGPAIDSVALGNLDVEDVEPGIPARFSLLADTPGRYPLVLLSSQRRIATLVVR